ncbi:hypothetical protein GN316_09285 [Xylophilus sp. Kf1]|nr:hypothetical protein [Xylophilus sp. Kf1]
MTQNPFPQDYSSRDDAIKINSYTTVLRREQTPHEVFATYWRDVHGPLCSRIPGLGWYVQTHFSREQDAHLWPQVDGVKPFTDYLLDGGVEIGFMSESDQAEFQAACHLLFADEQNMFDATVAYALPRGSKTWVDRWPESKSNGDDGLDRIHLHLGAAHGDVQAFARYIETFSAAIAADPAVIKLRTHLPEPYDNADPAPPAPDVGHTVSKERSLLAIVELAFRSPLERRAFYASPAFRQAIAAQSQQVAFASAFAVSGVYVYVRDKQLTTAGLRGSRAAQLISTLGALNQVDPAVEHLFRTGQLADS